MSGEARFNLFLSSEQMKCWHLMAFSVYCNSKELIVIN